MKKLLIAGLTLLSFQAFSQSYLVLDNGVTLTTDNAGNLYDRGRFILPYKLEINGGSFLVEDKKLSTIDEKGFIYEKEEKIKKYKGKGLNYLLTSGSELVTVASNGFYYKYEKDPIFKKVKQFGGNFFTVEVDKRRRIADIYTVNNTGNYYKMSIPGLNAANIEQVGGTYFMSSGIIYTVSKEGFIYPKPMFQVDRIKLSGGNFFIDNKNVLHTISEAGVLAIPTIPTTMVVSSMTMAGANYLLDEAGNMFVVDMNGYVHQQQNPAHDLGRAKILSL